MYVMIDIRRREKIIKFIKDTFESDLAKALNLERISAPLFVAKSSGLNDDLNGMERKVSFDALYGDEELEVVQSLAKWKRVALKKYGFQKYEGIYTDMNAIRRDDTMDSIHSLYVDQWDWEQIIDETDRKISYLKKSVKRIIKALVKTNLKVQRKFPELSFELNENCFFISTEDLRKQYPNLSAKEREYEVTKKYKTVFIIGIGKKLKDKTIHDYRAADYDDWNLNGDLLIYCETLDIALEISSMGIRVDSKSLEKQLRLSKQIDKAKLFYHGLVLNNELPFTIGGGIGQSRICLLLMQQAHIGEVQVSYWTKEELKKCEEKGIFLL